MLRRNNADHGDMLYFVDGYMTAWFMWQLQNDEEAAKAFVGDNAEILNNTLYQDIDKNIQSDKSIDLVANYMLLQYHSNNISYKNI